MIKARVVADSISEAGVRITTMQLRYHRFIHSEFMTHRVFSRNASSSRAIPVSRMLEQVWNDPAVPVHFGKNKAGMQADQEVSGFKRWFTEKVWRWSGRGACVFSWLMMKVGIHKQISNRILEPWQWMHVVVTATEWDNFFALRDHPDAQPEIRALAIEMKHAMDTSHPLRLKEGEWHLPYVRSDVIKEAMRHEDQFLPVKCSAARCARVSYLRHDGGEPTIADDLKLYNRLVGQMPIHASPTEHQATPSNNPHKHSGNFRGWIQARKLVEKQFAQ